MAFATMSTKPAVKQALASRNVSMYAQKPSSKQVSKEAMIVAASLLASAPAMATQAQDVEELVKTSQDNFTKAIDVITKGVNAAESAYEKYSPVVKQGYEKAAPVVKEGFDATVKTLDPVVKQAVPYLQRSVSSIEQALDSSGLDTKAVKSTVSTVGDSAVKSGTPVVENLVNFVTTNDPLVVGEYGLGLAAAVFLGPKLLGSLAGSLRGYKGEISAPAALDTVCNDGNTYIVDIRSNRDKEMGGVPDLPGGAANRLIELEFCMTENKRLRGQLRNPDDIETKVTAMQVAALKRLSPGNTVYLMDKDGGLSRRVARELATKGFRNTFVIAGGFEGRNGWSKSKLQTKPSSTVRYSDSFSLGKLGTVVTGNKSRP